MGRITPTEALRNLAKSLTAIANSKNPNDHYLELEMHRADLQHIIETLREERLKGEYRDGE